MIINFNMLDASMENRIDCHMERIKIITIKHWWRYQGNV
jgi:aryl carrier-like protein